MPHKTPFRRVLGIVLISTMAMLGEAAAAPATEVHINGLNDINLGIYPGSGPMQGIDVHCVGIKGQATSYQIRANGSGAGNAYALSNGIDTINYNVRYRDNVSSTAWTSLLPDTFFNFVGLDWKDCRDGIVKQEIKVDILESNLSGKASGAYSGTLFLLVSPI